MNVGTDESLKFSQETEKYRWLKQMRAADENMIPINQW